MNTETEKEKRSKKLLSISRAGETDDLVAIAMVAYIKADDDYSLICCVNGRKVLVPETIGSLLIQIEDRECYDFVRINRSVAVNINHAHGISKDMIWVNDTYFYMTGKYKKAVRDLIIPLKRIRKRKTGDD